jgi:hypothetical protein
MKVQMREVNMSAQINLIERNEKSTAALSVRTGVTPTISENELRSYEVDLLSQFRANLSQLEELSARMGFMMNEVSGLIKKR